MLTCACKYIRAASGRGRGAVPVVLPPRGSAGRANKKFWIHILLSLSRLSLRYVPRVSRPTRASPGDRHTARAVKCNVWPRPDEARGEAGDDATSPGALSQLPSDLAVVACRRVSCPRTPSPRPHLCPRPARCTAPTRSWPQLTSSSSSEHRHLWSSDSSRPNSSHPQLAPHPSTNTSSAILADQSTLTSTLLNCVRHASHAVARAASRPSYLPFVVS